MSIDDAPLLETFWPVETRTAPDGTTIAVTTMRLPPGWNQPTTQVLFVVPVAFPSAQPDCFYTDLNLRLAGGAMPANTGVQPLEGAEKLWFSWHLASWSPGTDTIDTYLRFIERRLRDVH